MHAGLRSALLALPLTAALLQACGGDDRPAADREPGTLLDVSVADDVVTFEFAGTLPDQLDDGYVQPPHGSTETEDPPVVEVAGQAFLRLSMQAGANALQAYAGPERYAGSGAVTEVVHDPDTEGYDHWIVGLDAEHPYEIETDGATLRVRFSAESTAPSGLSDDAVRSLELPASACRGMRDEGVIPPAQLTLVDGEVPGLDTSLSIAIDPAETQRGDVDGDGREDVVVALRCVANSIRHAEMHAFDPDGLPIGSIQVGEGFDPAVGHTPYIWSFELGASSLDVTFSASAPDEPRCCGTLRVTDRYEYVDADFTRVDREVGSAPADD